VLILEVSQYFIGTTPLDSAEWTLFLWGVDVRVVPLELLDPPKVFFANCTAEAVVTGDGKVPGNCVYSAPLLGGPVEQGFELERVVGVRSVLVKLERACL
jgi:hypothetical protein